MLLNHSSERIRNQTVQMRPAPRPVLMSLFVVGALAVVGVAVVAPEGSGAAAPAALPPIVVPAQVGPSPSLTGMLQAERKRFDCIDRVNAERALVPLPPLTYDLRLARAASDHAAYQAATTTMTHNGANGSQGGQRMTAAGYQWTAWGENVARGQYDCESVVGAWMDSKTHRDNILHVGFVHIGMGMAFAADGTVHWTMNLGSGG